jgi:hypothetical protein
MPTIRASCAGERIADCGEIFAYATNSPTNSIAAGNGHGSAQQKNDDWQMFHPT